MNGRIPANWTEASVKDLFWLIGGGTPSTKTPEYWRGDIPWITSADIGEDHSLTPRRHVSEAGIANSAANKVPKGSLIVATRVGVGKTAVAGSEMCFSQDCQALIPRCEGLKPEFFMYQTEASVSQLVGQSRGTTISGVTKASLGESRVRLAPTGEQHRIVEAIESYLTQLDDVIASLERVQRNLERYRASVLKAAVEGRLVPNEAELARREGRDYEPASELIKRNLAERKRRWIEDAAEKAHTKAEEKARRVGKPWTPEDDARALQKARKDAEAKYVEPTPPDTTDLPELPEGWCWATLDALSEVQGGLAKGTKRAASRIVREVPYLRVANVQRGYLELSDMKSIAATEDEIARLALRPGDVLFNEGGDRDKLGRGWVWEGQIEECIHQNHVFRVRVVGGALLPKILSWYGNTSAQDYFFVQGKQTTNLASISLTRLKALPVPIAPAAEQSRIQHEVERLMSLVDALVSASSSSSERAQNLRQSILKWAFEGKLVEQDPNDEPASVLLERIKAEREKATAGSKGGKRRCRS